MVVRDRANARTRSSIVAAHPAQRRHRGWMRPLGASRSRFRRPGGGREWRPETSLGGPATIESPRLSEAEPLIGEAADHSDKDLVPRRETAPRSCAGGPTPTPPGRSEIGHLLTVRLLVELPDDVGADLAGGGQDPKEIPTCRWSERVSEASSHPPKHRGASVSAAWATVWRREKPWRPPGQLRRHWCCPASSAR
jgi:hypothetical protein